MFAFAAVLDNPVDNHIHGHCQRHNDRQAENPSPCSASAEQFEAERGHQSHAADTNAEERHEQSKNYRQNREQHLNGNNNQYSLENDGNDTSYTLPADTIALENRTFVFAERVGFAYTRTHILNHFDGYRFHFLREQSRPEQFGNTALEVVHDIFLLIERQTAIDVREIILEQLVGVFVDSKDNALQID